MKGTSFIIYLFPILLLTCPLASYSGQSEIECETSLEQHFQEWLGDYRQIQDANNIFTEANSKIERLSQLLSEYDIEPCSGGTKLAFNKLGFEIQEIQPELKAIIELKKMEKGVLVNGKEIHIVDLYKRWNDASKTFDAHLIELVRHFRKAAWLRRRS